MPVSSLAVSPVRAGAPEDSWTQDVAKLQFQGFHESQEFGQVLCERTDMGCNSSKGKRGSADPSYQPEHMERIKAGQLEAQSRPAPAPAAPEEAEPEPAAIAFIDDDVVMLKLMSVQFKKLGGKVTTFNGGEAFLDSAAKSKAWDIIVVDHLMPGMNGIQTMRAIAQNKHKSTLMCMASGEAFPAKEDQEAMDRLGCPFFLKGKKCCADIMNWYGLSHDLKVGVQPQPAANSDGSMVKRTQKRESALIPVAIAASESAAKPSKPDLLRAAGAPPAIKKDIGRKLTPLPVQYHGLLRTAITHPRCPRELRSLTGEQVRCSCG